MAERALAPAVEKLLVVGLVTLFVAGGATIAIGDVVPEVRQATGQELGDRVLAQAGNDLAAAADAGPGRVHRRVEVELPASIDGRSYDLVLSGRRLQLDHPDPSIATDHPLAVTSSLRVEPARVDGGGDVLVVVRGPAENRTVTLRGATS